ncbi:Lysosome-associated membrane glycoprotein 1 [Desmophyllum pertusum]|uniref:Lysosome-associated membrane glycoprotein 5 n=1 Tax=Desmophyllum pertusum TaxID=174260 RepID=A0A9X0A393_9CNID|nr:Lysosome-associated membrane glycoprotein 1 [Desmophyllum pertusum]
MSHSVHCCPNSWSVVECWSYNFLDNVKPYNVICDSISQVDDNNTDWRIFSQDDCRASQQHKCYIFSQDDCDVFSQDCHAISQRDCRVFSQDCRTISQRDCRVFSQDCRTISQRDCRVSHKTVTPSHNKTVTPSHNKTVTPSHNMTVTPSHNMTVTPSHMTIMPHNRTVMPSHNMTIMPSSAHTVMPSSSVHPTPGPKTGNFSVKNNNGTDCLLAHMAAKFDIMIVSTNNSMKLSVDLPNDATVSGECDDSSNVPYIALNWLTKEGHNCSFIMHFSILAEGENLKAAHRWTAANLTFSLKMTSGVTESAIYTFHSGMEALNQLSAEVGHAYECTTTSTGFKLTANHSDVNVTLTKIEFQPFEVKDGHPGKVEVCTSPTTLPPIVPTTPKKPDNSVVAIAVGCSLAGLVLIVGIGYMIGRRRNRNSQAGYRKL